MNAVKMHRIIFGFNISVSDELEHWHHSIRRDIRYVLRIRGLCWGILLQKTMCQNMVLMVHVMERQQLGCELGDCTVPEDDDSVIKTEKYV